MRRTINIITLLFFVWLVVDAINLPGILLNFLLVGAIPGTTVTLSPNIMLALLAVTTLGIVYAVLARRYESLRRLRHNLAHPLSWRNHLPNRRYGNA